MPRKVWGEITYALISPNDHLKMHCVPCVGNTYAGKLLDFPLHVQLVAYQSREIQRVVLKYTVFLVIYHTNQ